ncbi:MAG: metallophosphoesterase [Marinilabiliales bacterium]|nr:metallophosphoesterase [Marinilabiliales bacterium]
MKRFFRVVKELPVGLLVALLMTTVIGCQKPKPIEIPVPGGYHFFVLSDLGSTEGYKEDSMARTVNLLSGILKPVFVINQGDFFHDDGVKDTLDPRWKQQFENLYNASSLNVSWYSIIGNHEYYGNPQALVDYGLHHARWVLPARNYTFVQKVDSSTSIRFVMIDTSPLVYTYRFGSSYKEVKKQDPDRTVAFVDSVLSHATEKWKIVVGHHPVYTSDLNHGSTYGLIDRIAPLLVRYKVDFYLSGHVHKFEHLQRDGVDYLVTSTAVKTRWINPWFYTRFVCRSQGFTVGTVKDHRFTFCFLNEKGKPLYSYSKEKP